MRYGELLKEGAASLAASGIEASRVDAERLLMDLLESDRSYLFLHREDEADPAVVSRFCDGIARRAAGEPVQYITGRQEFMGRPFRVTPAVLIPRLDTEVLVEKALALADDLGPERELEILDMCCGSGAIALSLLCERPLLRATACDISAEALAVAAANAASLGVEGRVRFLRTDMFEGLSAPGEPDLLSGGPVGPPESFDMILCNPPYIPTDVIPTLGTDVREHEPIGALDGGPDGLAFYRVLAADAAHHLLPGGVLIMEIGHDQAAAVEALLAETGWYTGVETLRDLAGLDRVVWCYRTDASEAAARANA